MARLKIWLIKYDLFANWAVEYIFKFVYYTIIMFWKFNINCKLTVYDVTAEG